MKRQRKPRYPNVWWSRLHTWFIVFLLCTLWLLVGPAAPVGAHGGNRTLQLMNTAAGSYRLTIWTAPSILRTGEIHVEVAASDSSGQPLQTGLVHVEVIPSTQTESLQSALALPVAETKGTLREAKLLVEKPGLYQIAVTVVDELGAEGRVSFDVEVVQVPQGIQLLIYALLCVTLAAGFWLLKEGFGIWSQRKHRTPPPVATGGGAVC
jgi:hypothetical protein